MTPLDVLRRARDLIAEPEAWVQGKYAIERDGRECFCLSGAISRAQTPVGIHPFGPAYDAVAARVGGDLSSWNDKPERTHAEVLAALDATIARLEAG